MSYNVHTGLKLGLIIISCHGFSDTPYKNPDIGTYYTSEQNSTETSTKYMIKKTQKNMLSELYYLLEVKVNKQYKKSRKRNDLSCTTSTAPEQGHQLKHTVF